VAWADTADVVNAAGPRPEIGEALQHLLVTVELRFYATLPKGDFHRDRRMLLYAMTWPSTWLKSRGLTCSSSRYNLLIAERLESIAAHGDPGRYGAYFPAYLLKCLQDWFQHHGEELYDELKHIRNALDQVLTSARFAANVQRDAHHIELLAEAHRLIQAKRARRGKRDTRQMSLWDALF
jgi:hypothetical protein